MIEGAGKAQGDFERTSGSAANKQRQLAAAMENLRDSIGAGALPVLEEFVDVAQTGVGVFQGLDRATAAWPARSAPSPSSLVAVRRS
jgi:hypothetical protein